MRHKSTRLTFTGLLALCLVSFPLTTSAHRVEFILDGSGSMWGRVSGEEKIVAAKRVMKDLITDIELAPESELGLVVYGHRKKGDCQDIEQFDPVVYSERKNLLLQVESISPKGKTPIAATLSTVGESLKNEEGSTSIVLVSDGIESCNQDPCDVAKQLRDQYGIDVTVHVVGFDIKDGREQLECIANAGGGRYFNAANASELTSAFEDVKAELIAADQTPSAPPAEKKAKSFKISRATISVPNLQKRTIPVCTQESKCSGDWTEGWLGELTPNAHSMEVTPGTYKLKFHNHYAEGIEIGAGETIEVMVGNLNVSNLSQREVGVCNKESNCSGDWGEGWAGHVSPKARRLELPAGTYKLKFHNYYDEIEITASELTEVQISELTMPSIGAEAIPVCSPDAACGGAWQEGWLGEISSEAPSIEVPAGEYKIRVGKQFIGGITVAAGEKLVLE